MSDKKQKPVFYTNFERLIIMICLIGAIFFSTVGIFLPPVGIIDGSVLILVAEWLLFIASMLGFRINAMKYLVDVVENVKHTK